MSETDKVTKVTIDKVTHVVINCGYEGRFVNDEDIDVPDTWDPAEGVHDDYEYQDDADEDFQRFMIAYLNNRGCEFIISSSSGLIPVSTECRRLNGGPVYDFVRENFDYDSCIVFRADNVYAANNTIYQLQQFNHCACFGSGTLMGISYVTSDKYKMVGFTFDTESR